MLLQLRACCITKCTTYCICCSLPIKQPENTIKCIYDREYNSDDKKSLAIQIAL